MRLQLERAHAAGFRQRSGIGVAALDDVAEHLVNGSSITLSLAGGTARQALQLADQRLQLLVRCWLGGRT